MKKALKTINNVISTGINGLDEILSGGLPNNRLYVIQGEPGSGKTTLALEFLREASLRKEKTLYITFSETKEELEDVTKSHGWDLDGIHVIDFSTLENQLFSNSHNTLFHASEVVLTQLTDLLVEEIDRIQPLRVVIDSVSELRLLAEDPLRYRRQILALKHSFTDRKITVFFLDDLTGVGQDQQVQSIAHGVIELNRMHHEYGGDRRRLRVLKMRGVKFIDGHHDYSIKRGGIQVYPRMISAKYERKERPQQLSSGIPEMDYLLGGGIDFGTSNLIIGPAGSGKTSLAFTYGLHAIKQKEKVAYFSFEEALDNIHQRAKSAGVDLNQLIEEGSFHLQKVNPAELSPGEFTSVILNLVEKEGYSVICIDSLNGFVHAMPEEQCLTIQLHELLAYLGSQGIATIIVLAQQEMIGSMQSPVDLTYLADTVILTRFFEIMGSVRKAVSVIKKRTGTHETTIREFTVNGGGIRVGPVLKEFAGILTGVPQFHGAEKNILKGKP